MPYIWIPAELPYYVTDMTKLTIICPEEYKLRADRLDHNVPIFKETVTFAKGVPATPKVGADDELAQCIPCAPEKAAEPEAVETDDHVETDVPEEWVEDLSEPHALTHLPKCKKCDVCMKTKCFFTPHRKLENQSVERQKAAAMSVSTEFLGRVLLDHAVIGKENH